MLDDARQRIAAAGLQARIHLHQAGVQEVARLFSAAQFDLVLCHNVIQYVADVPALLRDLAALLLPGGLLSLVSINRFSDVYAAAFLRQDLAAALAGIGARTMHSTLFDTPLTMYSAEEAAGLLAEAGCPAAQTYGLLCLTSYWGDNERKRDPAIYAQLERLELALTDQEPYKRLARYYQVIAQCPASAPGR
jgi:S-adenosylmethionine-dependent methyltransferase